MIRFIGLDAVYMMLNFPIAIQQLVIAIWLNVKGLLLICISAKKRTKFSSLFCALMISQEKLMADSDLLSSQGAYLRLEDEAIQVTKSAAMMMIATVMQALLPKWWPSGSIASVVQSVIVASEEIMR